LDRPDLNFGTLDMWIGDANLKLGNLEVAEVRYRSMIEHRKRYFAAHPQIKPTLVRQSMAEADSRLGEAYRLQGKLAEAKPLLQQSLETRRAWYEAFPRDLKTGEDLAGALGSLSNLYEQTGEFEEMIAASQQALRLLRRSAANKSDFPTNFNLGVALKRLGRQYQLVDDSERAETHLRESVVAFESALKVGPDHGKAQVQAADSYYLLARLVYFSEQVPSGLCQRGIELCDQLLAKAPNDLNYRVMKMKLVALSGQVDEAVRLAEELVGERTSAYRCLCGAVGYALASQHGDESQRRELLGQALDCVRDAVLKLGFREFVVLRTDPDFAPLQQLDEFQRLLNEAESQ
jgi:tetratricopeptide (TPR) repeat protein